MSSGKAACCGDSDPIFKIAYNAETREAHLYCVECGCEGHPTRIGRDGSVTLSIAAAVALEDNRYVDSLKSLGFGEWHTGGGCYAMGLTLARHTILVTNQDYDVPQDNEGVSVGVYLNEPDGSWGEDVVEEFEGELAAGDLQALIERYLAKYRDPPQHYRSTCYFCRHAWGECDCDSDDPVCGPFESETYVIREPNVSACGRFFVDPYAYYGEAFAQARRLHNAYRCQHGCVVNSYCETCYAPMCDHSHEIYSAECLACEQKGVR